MGDLRALRMHCRKQRFQGVKNVSVMLRHLIPNAIAPALVGAAMDVRDLVVLWTTFSYSGLGNPTL